MQEKDYSEYTLTEAQKYRLRRRGNRAVLLDYFGNSASFDSERRTFHIQVDDGKEDDWMDSFIDEDAEATAQRLGKNFRRWMRMTMRRRARRSGRRTKRMRHCLPNATVFPMP